MLVAVRIWWRSQRVFSLLTRFVQQHQRCDWMHGMSERKIPRHFGQLRLSRLVRSTVNYLPTVCLTVFDCAVVLADTILPQARPTASTGLSLCVYFRRCLT